MHCLNEHGDVVRIPVPGNEWFLISHPDHVKRVLVDQARNYPRGGSYDRFRLIFDKSIGTTDGEEWRPLRRMAQPAFHRESVSKMADMMTRCSEEMLEQWAKRERPEASFDVAMAMQQLTLRIIGLAVFSVDLRAETASELGHAVVDALEYAAGASNPFRMPLTVPTPANRRFNRSLEIFARFIYETLDARAKDEGEPPPDLLSMLLATVDPETGEGLSREQLRNELLAYLVAGHETSANTLSWLFFMLSRHPLVARRVEAELAEVLGDEAPTVAKLDELRYLDQVIHETMRLYPPAFMLPREVQSEDNIGGYTIPAGAWMLVSPYVTHRRPDIWDNPEGFDPDRFLPEAVAARAPLAHFPFFAGPHKCIGQVMAMMEIKLVVAAMLRRCRLDLVPGFEPGLDAQVTLRPRHGVLVTPCWRT
ncbi:MAG: cytochrome P450, partial [Myxococcales bacterium]|nr:cytochrome P450 [Myxococcales bacterium]